jgi:mannose-6-phosphate isomerase-like protein (cupin superfamily)
MVKRSTDMEREIRERMRDGDGEVEIQHLFKGDEITGKARLLAKVQLKKNCSIGLHRHDEEEEVYYILSGRGVVTDDGKEYQVGPGDAVLTGGGGSHSIRNNEDEPLDFVAVILLYS